MVDETRPSPYRWVIEALLIASLLVQEAIWLAPAPILEPIIQTFNIGLGRAGILVSVFALFLGVFAITSGLVGQHLGILRSLVAGAWMMGPGVLSGYATSYWMLFACRALEGIGFGIVMGPGQALPMQWFPPREWPYINGVNLLCANISLTLTFAVTAPLYYHFGSSWGTTLRFYGLLEVGVAILWTVFGREKRGAPAPATAKGSLRECAPTRLEVLLRRDVLMATLGIFGGVWGVSLSGAFMPQFFHIHRSLTLTQAGTLASIPTLAAIAGSLLGGVASGVAGRRKPFTWPLGLIGVACALGALLIPDYSGIFAAQLIGGLVGSMPWPVVITLTMELPGMTPELAHTALACVWGVAFVGGFFAPLIAGAVAQVIGLQASMIIFTLVGLSQFAFYFMPETGRNRAALQVASQASL
jgi:MFS family permease